MTTEELIAQGGFNRLTGGTGPEQIPSGSVFTNTTNKIHKYPLYLESSPANQGDHSKEQARECIQFTAIRQAGINFNKDVRESAAKQREKNEFAKQLKANASINSIGNGSVNSIAQQDEARKAQALAAEEKRVKALQKGDGSAEDSAVRAAAETVRDIVGTEGLTQLRQDEQRLEDCFLYMPPSVVYNEGAVWQNEELGAIGQTISSALRGSKSISDLLGEFGVGMAVPIARAGAVAAGAFVAGKVGGILTLLGGGGIESSIKSAGRFAQNPYEEQLFSNIPFRSFTFNFDFSAVNEEEYLAVKNIIKMFRSHSRPTFAISNGNQALYSYPNEFAIKFLHLDAFSGVGKDRATSVQNQFVENTNLPRVHNCVLTNITTNYAPDGWQAHEDGEPNSINMQLSFTETKKNTRVDIEKGY